LFRELVDTIHSYHNDQFLLLMRKMERKEGQTLDGTQTAWIAAKGQKIVCSFATGTVCPGDDRLRRRQPVFKLTVRAAELCMTAEEAEV
jgi:uncharacterized protein YecT (DUF1311 family)